MAETALASALRVQQWDSDFHFEYVRDNPFYKEMGTGENNIIQVVEDLKKSAGDKITVPFVRALTGAGVTGDSTLEGNEESLTNYGHQITVDGLRHGVALTKMVEKRSAIDMRDAARMALKFWMMAKMRTAIINALYSPVTDGKTLYADASEAQKDTWLTANSDRVQMGALRSNSTTTLDHSTSLANIDNTNDKLTTSFVSLLKRLAKTASPAITPYRLANGAEWFVLYAGSLPFRDLKESSAMQTANRDGWIRGRENPIFSDGDLIWDGVIIKEVPEIGVISSVGASSINVAATFLCGAQSVGLAWGQRTRTETDSRDYGWRYGVAIEEIRGVEKLMNNTKQNGVVTGYVAAVADS